MSEKVLVRIAKIASVEWREFLEAYYIFSPYIKMRIEPSGITACDLSTDWTTLVKLQYRASIPLEKPMETCLDVEQLLRGKAEEQPCTYEEIVIEHKPTARAKVSAEKLKLWFSEAERIEAEEAELEAKDGKLKFYAASRFCDCWVEDYAEAEGEAAATAYKIIYLGKAVRKINKPAFLEFATNKPLHLRWETPRVSFSLFLASLPRD